VITVNLNNVFILVRCFAIEYRHSTGSTFFRRAVLFKVDDIVAAQRYRISPALHCFSIRRQKGLYIGTYVHSHSVLLRSIICVTVEHITSNVRYLLSDQITKGVMSWTRDMHEE
jgi:hypothetical protein